MNRREMIELLGNIGAAYPQTGVASGVVDLWETVNGDLDYDDAHAALVELLRTDNDPHRRWIQPAEIRRRVFARAGRLAPPIDEAWQQAHRLVGQRNWRNAGAAHAADCRRVHTAVEQVVDALELDIDDIEHEHAYARFRDTYRTVSTRHDHAALSQPMQRALSQ